MTVPVLAVGHSGFKFTPQRPPPAPSSRRRRRPRPGPWQVGVAAFESESTNSSRHLLPACRLIMLSEAAIESPCPVAPQRTESAAGAGSSESPSLAAADGGGHVSKNPKIRITMSKSWCSAAQLLHAAAVLVIGCIALLNIENVDAVVSSHKSATMISSSRSPIPSLSSVPLHRVSVTSWTFTCRLRGGGRKRGSKLRDVTESSTERYDPELCITYSLLRFQVIVRSKTERISFEGLIPISGQYHLRWV